VGGDRGHARGRLGVGAGDCGSCLVDALHEEQSDRQHELQLKPAAEEFDRKFTAQAERARVTRRQELAAILEPLGMAELAVEGELEIVRELVGLPAGIPEHAREEFTVAPLQAWGAGYALRGRLFDHEAEPSESQLSAAAT
jgi:hypothetical protein